MQLWMRFQIWAQGHSSCSWTQRYLQCIVSDLNSIESTMCDRIPFCKTKGQNPKQLFINIEKWKTNILL